ncbi:hypothetical protein OLMES_2706 [Oleiphilus messinensis]|uniref:Uncharacterized protein n=1 Tax=Oleiphilus messinensis TaxID=141451 RepID=A0A1Y0IAH1_9GAMM|nr:hypothetical protein OLMES_2706 [Oleiphilus messinensis]
MFTTVTKIEPLGIDDQIERERTESAAFDAMNTMLGDDFFEALLSEEF